MMMPAAKLQMHLSCSISSPPSARPPVAVGCAKLGQLLVWEWRSDSYVLKQQGHYFDIAATAFSPDGSLIATGSDDRKVLLLYSRGVGPLHFAVPA